MSSELRFDDRVVIVTGAGGGLGRSHALLFARRGAKVLVNDLGGTRHGEGQSTRAADAVVDEITKAGGQAAPSYDSVEDGDKIVQAALDHFGRIDVVVNNAGILRDVSFHKMTLADWELIMRVHLTGSFRVTHAAWPHLRDQGYGRVIMTSSAAGIYGNFGQANYSAAKLGLLGLANTLAAEGARKGVNVNTIAPIAGSRLTETVLPEDLVKALDPGYVSPLVAWLCHEQCAENGGLFEVGGGYFGKLRWQRAAGATVRLGRPLSPELVRDRFGTIAGFGETTNPRTVAESMAPILANIEAGPSKGGNDLIDVDLALGYEFPPRTSRYDERDLAIYALSVGAAADPLDAKDLSLVYEHSSDGLRALPTFGVIPALAMIMEMGREGVSAPGLNYGFDRILHGEQYTEVKRPLPSHATLTHRARIKEIWDKGKGAVVNTEIKTYDEAGELLVVNELVTFVRGAGGWGGDSGPKNKPLQPPERAPDFLVQETTHANQALLYRLNGDWNPLHVDPGFAQMLGFERPILHGLCTFGYAARHVINAVCGGDPRFFKSIKVRFADTVLPGETLVTEIWRDGETLVLFRCTVKERDKVVISNAAIELYREIPQPAAATAKAPAAAPRNDLPTSADIFTAIGQHLAAHAELKAKVDKIFGFTLSAPDSTWTVDVKTGTVRPGLPDNADCTLALSDRDFMDMCTGKADAQKLYFGGQLTISGDLMASQKLSFLKKLDPELVLNAARNRAGGTAAAAAPPAASPAAAPASTPKSGRAGEVIAALQQRIKDQPSLAGDVRAVIQVEVTEPDTVFTLNLRAQPRISQGPAESPDTVLRLADADLVDLARGAANAQQLFQRGKLRVDGDVAVAHRLGLLSKLI